jgi:hypothetical protein
MLFRHCCNHKNNNNKVSGGANCGVPPVRIYYCIIPTNKYEKVENDHFQIWFSAWFNTSKALIGVSNQVSKINNIFMSFDISIKYAQSAGII